MFRANKIELQKKDEEANFKKSRYQFTDEYIGRLARSVYTASQLPEGDNYVAIIGQGDEKSNLEAINTLIVKNIDKLSELHGIYHLEKSLDILRSRFHDVESYICS